MTTGDAELVREIVRGLALALLFVAMGRVVRLIGWRR